MLLERLYDDTLAQGAYLIGCERSGVAVIIDPVRDPRPYLEAAAARGLRIAVVAETHIHADFVSGARELAARTGAQLVLSGEGGDHWRYRYADAAGARLVHDGDQIAVGAVRLEVRHTPGHTPEHISFLVTDSATSERAIGMCTGDFIFVGDVGRPDLLERAAGESGSADALARQLFRSIKATAPLADYLRIWPGHGAGSACGRALGALPSTTLGYERLTNWAFAIDDEDRFAREVLAGQPEAPPYFARMKAINRDGAAPLDDAPIPSLDLAAVRAAFARGDLVVDVRPTAAFAAGHIPGALNLPLGTSFVTWAGWLLSPERSLVLLDDDPDRIERARTLLGLIGLDRVTGWAGAQVRETWAASVAPLQLVPGVDVTTLSVTTGRRIVDVRSQHEWSAGHLPRAEHYFLGELAARTRNLPRDTPLALHCQGGTRSAIAASVLQAQGFTDIANATGGFRAWEAAGLPIVRDQPSSPQS